MQVIDCHFCRHSVERLLKVFYLIQNFSIEIAMALKLILNTYFVHFSVEPALTSLDGQWANDFCVCDLHNTSLPKLAISVPRDTLKELIKHESFLIGRKTKSLKNDSTFYSFETSFFFKFSWRSQINRGFCFILPHRCSSSSIMAAPMLHSANQRQYIKRVPAFIPSESFNKSASPNGSWRTLSLNSKSASTSSGYGTPKALQVDSFNRYIAPYQHVGSTSSRDTLVEDALVPGKKRRYNAIKQRPGK